MPRNVALLALVLALTATSGCALDVNHLGRPAVPDRVRPTLEAWSDEGMSCTGPAEDDVPSGLLAWSCQGVLAGVEISGTLEGDDQGLFDFQVVVPAATQADVARDAFALLVDATPPLDGLETDIVDFIDGWPGIDVVGTFGDARVRVDVDDIWRALTVSPGPRHQVDEMVP